MSKKVPIVYPQEADEFLEQIQQNNTLMVQQTVESWPKGHLPNMLKKTKRLDEFARSCKTIEMVKLLLKHIEEDAVSFDILFRWYLLGLVLKEELEDQFSFDSISQKLYKESQLLAFCKSKEECLRLTDYVRQTNNTILGRFQKWYHKGWVDDQIMKHCVELMVTNSSHEELRERLLECETEKELDLLCTHNSLKNAINLSVLVQHLEKEVMSESCADSFVAGYTAEYKKKLFLSNKKYLSEVLEKHNGDSIERFLLKHSGFQEEIESMRSLIKEDNRSMMQQFLSRAEITSALGHFLVRELPDDQKTLLHHCKSDGMVKVLLEKLTAESLKYVLERTDSENRNIIYRLVKNQKLSLVVPIIDQCDKKSVHHLLKSRTSDHKRSLLHVLAVTEQNEENNTALEDILYTLHSVLNDKNMFDALLIPDCMGNTALHYATHRDSVVFLKTILLTLSSVQKRRRLILTKNLFESDCFNLTEAAETLSILRFFCNEYLASSPGSIIQLELSSTDWKTEVMSENVSKKTDIEMPCQIVLANISLHEKDLSEIPGIATHILKTMDIADAPKVLILQYQSSEALKAESLNSLLSAYMPAADTLQLSYLSPEDLRSQVEEIIKKYANCRPLLDIVSLIRTELETVAVFPTSSSLGRRLTVTQVPSDAPNPPLKQNQEARKGAAMIVSFTEARSGWRREYEDAVHIMKNQLGIPTVSIHNSMDESSEEILKTVKKFAYEHFHADFLLLVVLAFGNEGDDILCSDGNILEVTDLLKSVNQKPIQPKVALLQYCRGSFGGVRTPQSVEHKFLLKHAIQLDVTINRQPLVLPPEEKVSKIIIPDNFLVVFSTLPDSRAKRGMFMSCLRDEIADITSFKEEQDVAKVESYTPAYSPSKQSVAVDISELMLDVACRVRTRTGLAQHLHLVNCLRQPLYIELLNSEEA